MKRNILVLCFILLTFVIFSQDNNSFCGIPFGSSKEKVYNILTTTTALQKHEPSETNEAVTYYGKILGKQSFSSFFFVNDRLTGIVISFNNTSDVQSYIDIENKLIESYGMPDKSVITLAKENAGLNYIDALSSLKDALVKDQIFTSYWNSAGTSVVLKLEKNITLSYINEPIYTESLKTQNGDNIKL